MSLSLFRSPPPTEWLIMSLMYVQPFKANACKHTPAHSPRAWLISNLMLVKRHHFSVECWRFVGMNYELCKTIHLPLSPFYLRPPSIPCVRVRLSLFLSLTLSPSSSFLSSSLAPSHRSSLCLPDHHNQMWFIVTRTHAKRAHTQGPARTQIVNQIFVLRCVPS